MDSFEKLQQLFSKFPTVGKRTAGRFVFYLVNQPKATTDELIRAIQELKQNTAFCVFCFQPFQISGNQRFCHICADPQRNKAQVCIVEKEQDLLSIEKTHRYKGVYFVLGSVNDFRKTSEEDLRLQQLKERLQSPTKFGFEGVQFSEIIVATNPTAEGKATSALVHKALKELLHFTALKVTHLAQGLPVGGELEYADEETLESAFEGRK